MPTPAWRGRCMSSSRSGSGPCRRLVRETKYNGLLMIFLSRMLAITRGHRGLLSIAVLGSVLYTALSVLPALIIRQMLTVLSRPSPAGTLVLLGLAMLGATALMAVARYLEGGFGHIAAFNVLHDHAMRI